MTSWLSTRQSLRLDAIAFVGEFCGTTIFLFFGLGGAATAIYAQADSCIKPGLTLCGTTVVYISTSMGLSLLVSCWMFYRISGALFNPAITLALYVVQVIPAFRAIVLFTAQILGGILASALIYATTPGGVAPVITTLAPEMSLAMGVFLEAITTAGLVFAVLMLACEKHRGTFCAPIGIGLTLFVGQLYATLWTGCGMNPTRSFGPSVVAGQFNSNHWIYWVGPALGSLIASAIYVVFKAFQYELVVANQDADRPSGSEPNYGRFFGVARPTGALLETHGTPTTGTPGSPTTTHSADLEKGSEGTRMEYSHYPALPLHSHPASTSDR